MILSVCGTNMLKNMQFLYWVLKNRVLQTLKVSINHWNEQESLVNVCPRTCACLDMGDFHVTLQQMLYVVSVYVSITCKSSCHEKCVLFKNSPVLLEYPDSFFLLIAATPLYYRQHLVQTYSWQQIECGDPINWPVWSPDLNSLKFWLWGHLKACI